MASDEEVRLRASASVLVRVAVDDNVVADEIGRTCSGRDGVCRTSDIPYIVTCWPPTQMAGSASVSVHLHTRLRSGWNGNCL